MGWGNCDTDSKGRPIGYVFPATCDHPDCLKAIDWGLDYACGGMHGEDEHSCEKYFCEDHRDFVDTPDGKCESLCGECASMVKRNIKEECPDDCEACDFVEACPYALLYPDADTPDKPDKGEKGGSCNRKACQQPKALYYNHSTRKYYCKTCATMINDANRTEAMRLFGQNLCTLERNEGSGYCNGTNMWREY